jgi:hypothetical protein
MISIIAKDIAGNILTVGDQVYYARKMDYHAKGELIKVTVTDIKEVMKHSCTMIIVQMGKYTSTEPDRQLIKII